MEDHNAKLVYTVEETRHLLGLSRSVVYEGIRRGEIPSIRVGRRILVPKHGLKFLLEKAVESTGTVSASI